MEDFQNDSSCVSGRHSSNSADRSTKEGSEESSWTTYIVDFFINGQEKRSAPSSPVRKNASSAVVSDEEGLSMARTCGREMSFKRRKKKGSLVDDALEDTASSPINSPKLRPKLEDNVNQSTDKAISSGKTEGIDDVAADERASDSKVLEKRGLCLVPLSMVVNYLG